jgi:signal transduction histidine kinase
MDLRKISQMRQMKILSWNLSHFVAAVVLSWTVLLIPFTFSKYLENCRNDLRELKLNLNSQLQLYHSNLKNSRWALTRFQFLRNHFFKADQKLLNSLEGIFLPGFSFGSQNEYFILRDLDGNTKLEALRGALVSRHSEVFIPNEKDLVRRGEGLVTTPCKINQVSYLCLISTPDLRDYQEASGRYIAMGAIPRLELFTLARAPEVQHYSWFRLDQPGFHFAFDAGLKQILEGGTGTGELFRQNVEVYPGFWISLSYPWTDFLIVTTVAVLFLSLLVIVLGLVISQVFQNRIKTELEMESLKNQKENYDRVQLLVKGVIHDIESPLAALRVLSAGEQDADRKSLFDLLFKRIRLIVSDLEGKGNSGARVEPSSLPIVQILNSIVLEKQKELGPRASLSLELGEITSAWICGVYSDIFRMLSNIINNSVQASEKNATIRIQLSLDSENQRIKILIIDYGKGIPDELQHRVFEKGATFGKSGGSGIGLFQARNTARAMEGDIFIRSNQREPGTTVEIELPAFDQPSWYRAELRLIPGGKIVLVDDEEIIQKVFQDRFKRAAIEYPIQFFSHPHSVPKEVLQDPQVTFVVDNNYGVDLSAGLRFCQMLPPERTVLFTSDWNLKAIQIQANELKVGLLGKEFLDHLRFIHI